jgi:phosphate transport system ATP-binding protein
MSPFPLSIYDNVAYGPRNNGIVNNKILDGIVQNALDDVAL